jgi:hypothetical protein
MSNNCLHKLTRRALSSSFSSLVTYILYRWNLKKSSSKILQRDLLDISEANVCRHAECVRLYCITALTSSAFSGVRTGRAYHRLTHYTTTNTNIINPRRNYAMPCNIKFPSTTSLPLHSRCSFKISSHKQNARLRRPVLYDYTAKKDECARATFGFPS